MSKRFSMRRVPREGDTLILCSRGRLFLYWWDERARRRRQNLVGPEALIAGWTNELVVEGATVGDLLGLLAGLRPTELRLLDGIAGRPFTPFAREARKRPVNTGIDLVQIEKVLELKDMGRFGQFGRVRRRGPGIDLRFSLSAHDGSPKRRYRWSSIPTGPLQEIAGARLVLKPFGGLFDERGDPDRRKRMVRFAAGFSVGEAISALLHEVCYDGSPELRDRRMADLQRRLKRVNQPGRSIPALFKIDMAKAKRNWLRALRIEEQLRQERHE
jgi:hypothetical protein